MKIQTFITVAAAAALLPNAGLMALVAIAAVLVVRNYVAIFKWHNNISTPIQWAVAVVAVLAVLLPIPLPSNEFVADVDASYLHSLLKLGLIILAELVGLFLFLFLKNVEDHSYNEKMAEAYKKRYYRQ